MRTREIRKLVRKVYRTAVCESRGDVYIVSILLPYGKTHQLEYGRSIRQAWKNAWRIVREQYPLVKMSEDRE